AGPCRVSRRSRKCPLPPFSSAQRRPRCPASGIHESRSCSGLFSRPQGLSLPRRSPPLKARSSYSGVMAALVPAISVFLSERLEERRGCPRQARACPHRTFPSPPPPPPPPPSA